MNDKPPLRCAECDAPFYAYADLKAHERKCWIDMAAALQADGDKLRAVTGQDHGPHYLAVPYPMCRTPTECAGKGYCSKDPACNE